MSECMDFQRLMNRSLDGEISQEERALLNQHLALCQNCTREFKALQLGLDMLVSMPVPEPDAGFTSGTVKKASRAKKIMARRQKAISLSLSGVAAMISILILVSWTAIFQPAIKWSALNILSLFSELEILLDILHKFLSALAAILIPLVDNTFHAVWQGAAPAFYGYLIALIILLFFILLTKDKLYSTLNLERR
jgi:predicted anti-sigma-YlaC factor YlaD